MKQSFHSIIICIIAFLLAAGTGCTEQIVPRSAEVHLSISGKVVGPDGKPIAGLEVTPYINSLAIEIQQIASPVITDQNGDYHIETKTWPCDFLTFIVRDIDGPDNGGTFSDYRSLLTIWYNDTRMTDTGTIWDFGTVEVEVPIIRMKPVEQPEE